MKNKYLILILPLAIAFLSGCLGTKEKTPAQQETENNRQSLKEIQKSQPKESTTEPAADPNQGLEVPEEPLNKNEGKLQEWVKKKEGMSCTIHTQSGVTIAKSKGGKLKVEGFPFETDPNDPEKPGRGTMINDGTWVYVWLDKEGVKFNIGAIDSLTDQDEKDSLKATADPLVWAKEIELEENSKFECANAIIADSDFSMPEDIQFKDLTAASAASPSPN